jgi:hypothetical protein
MTLFAAALAIASGEFGDCRYDVDACSCKMGSASQGICWDEINGQTGRCSPRACKAGWTCACGGRTHVCSVAQMTSEHNTGEKTTYKEAMGDGSSVQMSKRKSTMTRPCAKSSAPTASKTSLTLGSIKFGTSPNGVLNKGCHQLAWWHNGRLYGNYKTNTSMTGETFSSTMLKMDDHSLLEMRPGDVVAFRFREGSCMLRLMDATAHIVLG